jgi:hypothetical protein
MNHPGPVAAIIAVAFSGVAATQPALLAVAHSFKMLNEAAFAAPLPTLDAAAARALAMMENVRATLPPGVARDLASELRALDAARRAGDRPGISLASAEIYRMLVVLAGPHTKIPPEVRLLDYARMRYKADLQVRPPRWDDGRDDAIYARARWNDLRPRITEGSLRLKVDMGLDELDSAVRDRDLVRADQAANDFLDLIDQLEAYFAAL